VLWLSSSTCLGFGLALSSPHHLLQQLDFVWEPTCMSEDFTDPGIAAITVRFLGLTVSITGPADQASSLVSSLARHHTDYLAQQNSQSVASSPVSAAASVGAPSQRLPRPSSAVSESSYSWVPTTVGERRPETRDQIEASFDPCPEYHLRWASELRGGSLSGERRIRRAWRAGQWAKAVLDQRVATPNRTEPLDIRPKYYVVVRAICAWTVCFCVFSWILENHWDFAWVLKHLPLAPYRG